MIQELIYYHWKKGLLLVFSAILITMCVFAWFSYTNNPYGKELQIQNLSDYINNKPNDRNTVFQIKYLLYEAIERNSDKEIVNNSIKDIVIRSDTFNQTFDKDQGVNYVDFIVDIESLKQSYSIKYQWYQTENQKVDGTDQYGNMVSCLPSDQLKYGDFGCQDLLSDMSGSKPRLVISWAYLDDQYGNSIDSQLQPFETEFIESQILGDYKANYKLKKMNIDTDVKNINRIITTQNILRFNITVGGEVAYEVSVDYDDDRYTKITNTKTGLVIDRKIKQPTEDD